MIRSASTRRKMVSQACLQSFSGSSFQATYDHQLASASYGTVYTCSYDGSKAFTVLAFHSVGDSNFSTTDYSMSLHLRL